MKCVRDKPNLRKSQVESNDHNFPINQQNHIMNLAFPICKSLSKEFQSENT